MDEFVDLVLTVQVTVDIAHVVALRRQRAGLLGSLGVALQREIDGIEVLDRSLLDRPGTQCGAVAHQIDVPSTAEGTCFTKPHGGSLSIVRCR
ncbi:MAG: hypothetical protein M3370_10375 [Actinomycetota bacterium]|nr:hypothetical protein [Actinomycetota bacterium]